MKLIIDIPCTTYAFVKELQWIIIGRGNCKTIQQTVINAIKFGVKQPQGEWLHKEFDPFLKEYGQCSNCLQIERVGNFCRNCGADMRGCAE